MEFSKIQRMYILSFLFTLHIALSAYVNSTFLTQIISEKYVGLLYTTASVITLLLLARNTNFLKNFGNRKLSIILLCINMLGFVFLIGSQNPILISLAFVSILATNTLIILCLDIFIEHFGNPTTIGKTRGLYLTINNLAWVLSPLVTGILITREGGYVTIYSLALVTTLIMTLGLIFSVTNFSDKKYVKAPLIQSYKYLQKNTHMLAITIINFILNFFFAVMVIYTPIYLINHIGFNWSELGVIFTIMLMPFVIFGFPTGLLIDKYKVSKRKILYVGFMIIILSTLSIAFISNTNIALWALVLFLTRMGASIIETTSEVYFFTHIKEEETYLLSIYRDMTPVAYLIAPLFATVVFMFVEFKYIYIILSVILASAFYYIKRLKHNHEYTIPNTNQ